MSEYIDHGDDPRIEKLQPKWKNPPTPEDLSNVLNSSSSEYHSNKKRIDDWKDLRHATGKYKIKKCNNKQHSTTVPKLARIHAEWRYSSLAEPLHASKKLASIKANGVEDIALARQQSEVVNYHLNRNIRRVAFIDKAVRRYVNEATLCIRSGWVREETKQKVQKVVLGATGEPIGEIEQEEMVVTKNHPVLEVIPIERIRVDPDAMGDYDKAQFIAYDYLSNLDDLRKRGYKNLEAVKIARASAINEGVATYTNSSNNQVWVTEYWGKWDINDDGSLVPIIASYVGGVMIKLRKNPFPDGFYPFSFAQYMPDPDSNYGEADAELLRDSQLINGALMRGVLDTLGKSAAGQRGLRAQALSPTERRKFERGEDYMTREGVNPEDAVYIHQFPEVSQTPLVLLDRESNYAEALTGVKTFGQGINSTSVGDVASNGERAMDAASKRESGILRRLAECLSDAFKKVSMMCLAYHTPDEVERITGQPYVPAEPAGMHEMDLTVSVRTPEQDQADADRLAFILQTVGNNSDPKLVQLIWGQLLRLQNQDDFADIVEQYEPQPDPLEIERQQLEIELLKAQITELQSQAMENQARGQNYQAQAQKEQSHARKLEAEADKAALEYVEEESGTNHEREKELASIQAQSNIQLAALKGKLELLKESAKPKPAQGKSK